MYFSLRITLSTTSIIPQGSICFFSIIMKDVIRIGRFDSSDSSSVMFIFLMPRDSTSRNIVVIKWVKNVEYALRRKKMEISVIEVLL